MCAEAIKLPGFVDLQVNGFLGTDFSSPELTENTFAASCRALLARGTAAFLPTLITSPFDVYHRNLALIAKVMQRDEFKGRLLGFHIEGPFISSEPGAVGAHDPAYTRDPDIALFNKLQDLANGQIRLLTLAAELPGAEDLTRQAVAQGITVSLGHTLATAADMERLVQAGAIALTHLGNGLPNLLPRHHSPIWAGLAQDLLTAMLIADGHHLPVPVLKSMIRAKSVDRVVVVSDASPVAGLPPGRYQTLGNTAILEPSGRLHNPAKNCLVGSSATLLECVNHLSGLGFLSPVDLTTVAYHNPLRLIGVRPSEIHTAPSVIFDEESGRFLLLH